MQLTGIIIGVETFLMIGFLHIAVVRIERIWGSQIWPGFIVLGLVLGVASLFVENVLVSALLGVNGFLFAWSGPELKKQKERAQREHTHM